MEFVNLTPHTINVVTETETLAILASGTVARVATVNRQIEIVAGIPVFATSYGDIEGLPEPQPGVVYIVSGLVLAAIEGTGRVDVFAPGELVRNEEGQPVGCKGLRRNLS